MKNKIIFILISITIVIAGTIALVEFSSYRDVAVALEDSGYSVDIYHDDTKTNSVSNTSTIRLKEGIYTYKVIGDKYSNVASKFTVSSNGANLSIAPSYSDTYLNEALQTEQPAIQQLIATKYPFTTDLYTLSDLKLHKKGEWASGQLITNVDRRGDPDYYRFVLHKEATVWNFAVTPQLAINKSSYKNVPEDILYGLYTK